MWPSPFDHHRGGSNSNDFLTSLLHGYSVPFRSYLSIHSAADYPSYSRMALTTACSPDPLGLLSGASLRGCRFTLSPGGGSYSRGGSAPLLDLLHFVLCFGTSVVCFVLRVEDCSKSYQESKDCYSCPPVQKLSTGRCHVLRSIYWLRRLL